MSMRRALRSKRGFGVFWLGFSASVPGDAVTRTTLIWYVFQLTGSTVSLGWLTFCFTAPVIVGGMTAGWLLAAARIIARSPVLASTTLMYLVFNVGLGALLVVVPVFADTVLGGGPALYGLLLGCIAVGELAGSLTAADLRSAR